MSGSPEALTTFVIEAGNPACPACRVPFGYREPNITVRQSLGATLRGLDVLAFEVHPACASRVDIDRDKDMRRWCNAIAACDMATKMGLGIRAARLVTGLELDSGLLPKPSAEGLAAFRLAHMPEHADGQLGRIADRFALVAVAGELATDYGLTGWESGWATRAAVACFHGMVKLRPGGFGSGEEASMLRQARTYFAEHGEDRFAWWERSNKADDRAPNTQQRAGFRKSVQDAIGDTIATEWFVLPDVFIKQVCEGHDREAMLKLLRDRGHLVPDKGRPFDHTARLPGIGKTRCYRIKSSILDDISEA